MKYVQEDNLNWSSNFHCENLWLTRNFEAPLWNLGSHHLFSYLNVEFFSLVNVELFFFLQKILNSSVTEKRNQLQVMVNVACESMRHWFWHANEKQYMWYQSHSHFIFFKLIVQKIIIYVQFFFYEMPKTTKHATENPNKKPSRACAQLFCH